MVINRQQYFNTMANTVVSKASKWFSLKKSKPNLSVPDRRLPTIRSNSSSPSPSTEGDRRSLLWDVFRHFDQDSDGRISCHELRASFASVGEEMTAAAAEEFIAELDSDGDRLLDFEDFVKLMEEGSHRGEEEAEEELRRVFEMFEAVKGSGRITPRGLQKMLGRLGDERSIEECKAMIRAYDLDGDGEIDFHEFYRMMY